MVVADVATAPDPPRELIVEVALKMEEVRMGEAVMLDAGAVKPDVMNIAAAEKAPVWGGGFSRNGTRKQAAKGHVIDARLTGKSKVARVGGVKSTI